MVASVSCTTRKQRGNEIDGKDYNFISADMFSSMVEKKSFLEHAKVFDCFYGTPKNRVEDNLKKGLSVILEIDWQGAEQIRMRRPESISIFLLPPSKEELKKRLTNRATDSSEQIELRFQEAIKDIEQYNNFDRVIVNHDIDTTCEEIMSFVNNPHTSEPAVDKEALAVINSFI